MVDHPPLLCRPHLEGLPLLQVDRIRWFNLIWNRTKNMESHPWMVFPTLTILEGLHANASWSPKGIFRPFVSPSVSNEVRWGQLSIYKFRFHSARPWCPSHPLAETLPLLRLSLHQTGGTSIEFDNFKLSSNFCSTSPNVELADIKEFKEQLKLQGVFINREPEHKGNLIISTCNHNVEYEEQVLQATGERSGEADQTQFLREPGWHRFTSLFGFCQCFANVDIDILLMFRATERLRKRPRKGTTGCFLHL